MAVIILTQTDTAATCSYDKFCYGGSDTAETVAAADAREGGTPGVGAQSVTIGNTETDVSAGLIVTNALGVTTWASGTHTLRLNIVSAQSDVSLTEIHVCRVNSSCVNQETLGSLDLGTPRVLGTVQVETFSITGVSAATSPASTDKLAYVLVFSNAHDHANRTVGWTLDQAIDTPIEGAAAAKEASGSPSILVATAAGAALKRLSSSGTPSTISVTSAGASLKRLSSSGAGDTSLTTAAGQSFKRQSTSGTLEAYIAVAAAQALKRQDTLGTLDTYLATISSTTDPKTLNASGIPDTYLIVAAGITDSKTLNASGFPEASLVVADGDAEIIVTGLSIPLAMNHYRQARSA